jgi:hypothetical protein
MLKMILFSWFPPTNFLFGFLNSGFLLGTPPVTYLPVAKVRVWGFSYNTKVLSLTFLSSIQLTLISTYSVPVLLLR